MQYGILDFYSTTAQVIPIALLTYLFTLRMPSVAWESTKLRVDISTYFNIIDFFIMVIAITPVVSVIAGIIGEAMCLDALYSGHPTPGNAHWTVGAIIIIGITIPSHIITLGLRRYYRGTLGRRKKATQPNDPASLGYL